MKQARRGSTGSVVSSYNRLAERGSRRVHFEHDALEPGVVEHHAETRELDLGSNPTVRCYEITSPRIDPAHDGVTVAHLTDLHVKGQRSTRATRQAVEFLNEIKPDVVALTGDYVRYSDEALPHLAEVLDELVVPKYATLGNHDHWLDGDRVADALREGGCQVLSNEHRSVDVRGAPLHLVGIDDALTHHADPEAAFSEVPRSGGTRVVLSHIPEVADGIGDRGGALVLSGHTHGGQIKIPGVTIRIFRRMGTRYLSGFFRIGGQMLYVSHGLGASVPIRILAPAEIAVFKLRSSA
jgi:predicted MPP superfamily phosphohydrolase